MVFNSSCMISIWFLYCFQRLIGCFFLYGFLVFSFSANQKTKKPEKTMRFAGFSKRKPNNVRFLSFLVFCAEKKSKIKKLKSFQSVCGLRFLSFLGKEKNQKPQTGTNSRVCGLQFFGFYLADENQKTANHEFCVVCGFLIFFRAEKNKKTANHSLRTKVVAWKKLVSTYFNILL